MNWKGLQESSGCDKPENNRFSQQINRRQMLEASAKIAGGVSTVGLGSVGTVSAALSDCTGSGNYNYQNSFVWSDDDDESADNQNCSNIPDYYKVEHASSLLYLGSCKQNNRWIHDFIASAHSEHFTSQSCRGSWNHSPGIKRHRASFDSNDFHSNFDSRADEWVKAHPDIGGQGSQPTQWMNWAYTAMELAVGAFSWKVGAAMALTDVYLDFVDNNPSTSYDLTYDWEIATTGQAAEACGSHFIWQDVQSDVGASDSVDFDYIDEAWGRNPNYTQIKINVQFYNAEPPVGGCSSSMNKSNCADDSTAVADPNVGEVMKNSKGESVEVVDVNQQKTHSPGSELMDVHPQNLTPGLREKINSDSPVQYKEFPMEITKTTIQGKIQE